MLVSIIIPVCNGEKFMKQTLESVYAQSYKNFEVVCVDDGSTDGSSEIIKRFDPRVIYQFQVNKGQSAARNAGIHLSHGDLIAFLDADDIWFPEKLKLQVNYFLDHPEVSMIHSNMSIGTNDSIITPALPIIKRHIGFSIFDELYLGNFITTASAVVLRSECLKVTGLFDENFRNAEDYDLWLRVAANFKVGYQDVVMGIYRVHGDNLSRDSIGMNIAVLNVLGKIEKLYPQHVSQIPKEKIDSRYLKLNYSVGYEYFCKYDLVNARSYFLNALKFKKTSLPIYIYILSTFLNAKMIDRIRIVKRKIRKSVD